MKYLSKKFRDECKCFREQYGFRSYRAYHYRVINDVFQSFYLHKSVSGEDCTVEFRIAPLCAGKLYANKTSCGSEHLKQFENDFSWFEYDRNNEKNIDDCVNTMIKYMKKYLMPKFERASNSLGALYECEDFLENHKMVHNFYLFYCLSLKSGLYDKAIEYSEKQIAQIRFAYNRNLGFWGNTMSEDYKNRLFNEILTIEHRIEMVSSRNMEYIDNFIETNEREALEELGLKKY